MHSHAITVGGTSPSAPTLCSTYSLLLGHSSGDLWTTSEYASMTCRLPHTARHTTGTTKTQAGRQTQIHTHSRHAQTHCSSELLKIPKACSLQNNPRCTLNPNDDNLIYPITGWRLNYRWVLAKQLIGTHLNCAQGSNTGPCLKWHASSSVTPSPSQRPWQPQGIPPKFPQLLPPMEEVSVHRN